MSISDDEDAESMVKKFLMPRAKKPSCKPVVPKVEPPSQLIVEPIQSIKTEGEDSDLQDPSLLRTNREDDSVLAEKLSFIDQCKQVITKASLYSEQLAKLNETTQKQFVVIRTGVKRILANFECDAAAKYIKQDGTEVGKDQI